MGKINKKLMLVIFIIFVTLFAGWRLSGSLTKNTTAPPKIVVPITAEITVNKSGFSPSTVKVKIGTEVIWRVKDAGSHRIVSNPHPSHTGLPDLDSKANISTNDTYAYTFNKAGTFQYHDESNPTLNGTVVVE